MPEEEEKIYKVVLVVGFFVSSVDLSSRHLICLASKKRSFYSQNDSQASQQHPQNAQDQGQPAGGLQPGGGCGAGPPEEEGGFGAGRGVAADGRGGDGVDVGEADVAAVEAVGLVDVAEALIAGFDKGDVDALLRAPPRVSIWWGEAGGRVVCLCIVENLQSTERRRARPARPPGWWRFRRAWGGRCRGG